MTAAREEIHMDPRTKIERNTAQNNGIEPQEVLEDILRRIRALRVLRHWQEWARGRTSDSIISQYSDIHAGSADPKTDYLMVECLIQSLGLERHRRFLLSCRWSAIVRLEAEDREKEKSESMAKKMLWRAVYDGS